MSACSIFEQNKTDLPKMAEEKSSAPEPEGQGLFCAAEWFQYVEGQLKTSDLNGHGPDIASPEWQSVIEFKLNLQKQPDLPKKSTPQWCQYIQQELDKRRTSVNFSCQNQGLTKVQKLICQRPEIGKLEEEANAVFKAALSASSHEQHPTIKAKQKAWVAERDACSKNDNIVACLEESYHYRLAELQARYQLIEGIGPVFYVCDDRPSDEIVVTFFPTQPASLIAERTGQSSFMLLQENKAGPMFQGVYYEGRSERFWEHNREAKVIWGIDAEEMDCEKMH